MFDINDAYNGAMVPAEGSTTEQKTSDGKLPPKTSEEILQYAREEAAEILEKTNKQADEILVEKKKAAEEEASRIVAEKVNEKFNALGDDLWSAKAGISEIVETSIELILGAIGNDKAFSMAVDKAIKDYVSSKTLTLHAHPDSANRLRLYEMSKDKTSETMSYKIIDDTNLDQSRCIIDTGEKRIEVSLKVQIKALKQSLANSLSGAKD